MYFSCNILLYFILCFWFRTRAAATQTDKCVESPCYYKQLHPDSYHVPSVHSYSPSVHSYSPSVLSESHTMARTDHFIFLKISRSPEVFSLHNEGNVLESWNFSVFIFFFFQYGYHIHLFILDLKKKNFFKLNQLPHAKMSTSLCYFLRFGKIQCLMETNPEIMVGSEDSQYSDLWLPA